MNTKIGTKRLIVNVPPYSMFKHNNTRRPKFVEIEIIEIFKDVPGEFSGNPHGEGYLAKGSDGYTYAQNYPRYCESQTSDGKSNWRRYVSDKEFVTLTEEAKELFFSEYMFWTDVCSFQCPAAPKFLEQYEYINWCETHQNLFYIDSGGCFYCKHNITRFPNVRMNMTEHRWFGWYDDFPTNPPTIERNHHISSGAECSGSPKIVKIKLAGRKVKAIYLNQPDQVITEECYWRWKNTNGRWVQSSAFGDQVSDHPDREYIKVVDFFDPIIS